jgi:hypothetical protein
MSAGEVMIVFKEVLPFSPQAIFSEAVMFIAFSIQCHQGIEVSVLNGCLSSLKCSEDLVHRVLVGLDRSGLRDVGPTEIWDRGEWAQVTAVELEDKSR